MLRVPKLELRSGHITCRFYSRSPHLYWNGKSGPRIPRAIDAQVREYNLEREQHTALHRHWYFRLSSTVLQHDNMTHWRCIQYTQYPLPTVKMAVTAAVTRLDAEDSSDEIDQVIVSALSSTNNPTFSPTIIVERKEYEKRLLSFQASSYYAKPACLSPLICARFG